LSAGLSGVVPMSYIGTKSEALAKADVFCAFSWPTTNFNQMRRGGEKKSNIFNRFYTTFDRFYTFFQIFLTFSTTFDVFKHELARLVLPQSAYLAYF
jgi:hypothetical protein